MLNQIIGDRYSIIRHLGSSGFGQTYLAKDQHYPGHPLCVVKQLKLKTISPDTWETVRQLFETEAKMLSKLGNHDQIPRLFAHFEKNQEFYLVQEFIEGEALSQGLQGHTLPGEEVLRLLADILEVLEFVHQQQVIHCNIKPSNLIRRKDGKLVLVDFGVVQQIGARIATPTVLPSATIAVDFSGYVPREQLAGKPFFSSDIYAVGMIGIQALSGLDPKRLPKDPKTSAIIWHDVLYQAPEDCTKTSSELVAVLDKMVCYDYRQRYQTATEALQALTDLNSSSTLMVLPTPLKAPGLVPGEEVFQAWLERGDALFQLQRYREAIAVYDLAIQAQPNDYLPWFKSGITHENLQQFEAALNCYTKVVALQPEDYLAWFKRGVVLENLYQLDEAIVCYRKVIELQPENYWAWHDLGKVLEALERFEEAVEAFDQAVHLKPNFQLAVESRRRLLAQLQHIDTLDHLQHYDEAVVSCDAAIAKNPNDDAIECYDKVIEFQPNNHWAGHDRGIVLEKLQQYEEALLSYERAIQMKGDLEAATLGQQRVMQRLNQTISEERTVPSADEETKPTEPPQDDYGTWFEKGQVLEKLQHYAEAVIAYSKAIQLNPHNPEVLRWRGNVLFTLGRYEEAIGSYDKAIQLQPRNAHLWCCLASSLVKLKRYREAIACFDKAIQLQPNQHSAWYWRGRVLVELRRYTEALNSYEKAIVNNPNFQPALRDRQRLQEQLQKLSIS